MPGLAGSSGSDLHARLALCGDGTVRGVIVGAVLDRVEKVMGAPGRARVAGALSTPRFVDFFTYPVADLLKAVHHGAETLGGERSITMRDIGASLAGPFFQGTPAGRLASSLLSGNVRRYCSGLPAAYTMVSSFGKRTVAFPREGECRFAVEDDPIFPELHAGAVESAARLLAGVASTTVTFEAKSLTSCTYVFRW